MECAGSQKHNGESPVFIYCMFLKIQLFFLILSSKASCFVEASHLVEDVQKSPECLSGVTMAACLTEPPTLSLVNCCATESQLPDNSKQGSLWMLAGFTKLWAL